MGDDWDELVWKPIDWQKVFSSKKPAPEAETEFRRIERERQLAREQEAREARRKLEARERRRQRKADAKALAAKEVEDKRLEAEARRVARLRAVSWWPRAMRALWGARQFNEVLLSMTHVAIYPPTRRLQVYIDAPLPEGFDTDLFWETVSRSKRSHTVGEFVVEPLAQPDSLGMPKEELVPWKYGWRRQGRGSSR